MEKFKWEGWGTKTVNLGYVNPGIALKTPRNEHFCVVDFSMRLAIASGTHNNTNLGGFCRTQPRRDQDATQTAPAR